MPPPDANGGIDPSAMPDFIAVAGRDGGIVGYVRKEAALSTGDQSWPVYGDDLRTVVGRLVPGKGFVPVGVNPVAVPNVPFVAGPAKLVNPPESTGSVLVFVRNAWSNIVWIAVEVGGSYADDGGYWGGGYVGAGCFAMPAGSRLVVLDGDPTEPPAQISAVLYTQSSPGMRAERSVDIDSHGVATVGSGVPTWWVGAPPC